ncbi:MAG: hypothetical protein K2G74_09375 [Muribaculaceae bacterium]|nr:hypothetical protein [Muribaculaceae bacterium]
MRLFKESIDRVKKGTNKLYKSLCEQKERGILNDFTIETVNGQEVWKILGSVEIKPYVLDENGNLPVKIEVLGGDIILYTGKHDETVVPANLSGRIILKHIEPEGMKM